MPGWHGSRRCAIVRFRRESWWISTCSGSPTWTRRRRVPRRAGRAGDGRAAQVERRLAAGEVLPLAGVPIAIKDDTDVAGVSSMCGTGIDTGPVSSDSAAVRRLREAGAVIIGKTHLP